MAAAKSKSKSRSSRSGGGGSGSVVVGVVIGLAIAAAGYLLYTHTHTIQHFFANGSETVTPHTSAPATTASHPIAPRPTTAHETKSTKKLVAGMVTAAKDAPFGPSEDVFEAGAHLYAANCARCHGTPKHDAHEGQSMHPPAVQFWSARHDDTISHHSAHEVYSTIAEGDIARGMPAFGNQMSETEIWQLTLLLRSSRLEMPEPVLHILSTSTNK